MQFAENKPCSSVVLKWLVTNEGRAGHQGYRGSKAGHFLTSFCASMAWCTNLASFFFSRSRMEGDGDSSSDTGNFLIKGKKNFPMKSAEIFLSHRTCELGRFCAAHTP